jgi:DNA-binding CsgD family transcriptional regulator
LWRMDAAERYGRESTAWFEDHELDLYRRLNASRLAELNLRRGHWAEARTLALELLNRETTAKPIRARALAMLGALAARTGNTDPWGLLDQAMLAVKHSDETQDLAMVRTVRIEAALITGDRGRARAEAIALASTIATWRDLAASEAFFWAWRAGVVESVADMSTPFHLHAQGKYLEAADAWREIGCPYYEALALAATDHSERLLEALTILHQLGATRVAQTVADQLRELGAGQIPRGPRAGTRRNPYGLTDRQVEILGMLGASLSNTAIADRLVLSPKTVDHHVAAVLRKLSVHDRKAAGEIARGMALELAPKDGVASLER